MSDIKLSSSELKWSEDNSEKRVRECVGAIGVMGVGAHWSESWVTERMRGLSSDQALAIIADTRYLTENH